MPSFQLFRIKVLFPVQLSLLPERASQLTRPDIVRQAVANRPAALSRGNTWHIGNVARIDDNGLYFAFGRTSSSTLPQLDPDTGDFVETPFSNAPFTHVLLDVPRQVCAIAAKSALAPTIPGIARQLARTLNRADVPGFLDLEFTVEPLRDPETFLEQLERAYSIYRFSMEFSRPNPLDVNRDLQEPMQRTIQEVHARSGKATLYGDSLQAAPLAKLTRAAAASGSNAEALLRLDPEGRPVKRDLKSTSVTFTREDIEDIRAMQPVLLGTVRELYDRIRRISDD